MYMYMYVAPASIQVWHSYCTTSSLSLTATDLRDPGEDIPHRERPDDETGEITNESGRGECRLIISAWTGRFLPGMIRVAATYALALG